MGTITFLEFDEEEISNIDEVIDDNINSRLRNSKTMIIVGIYKDAIKDLIRPLKDDEKYFIDFEGVGTPDYIVDSRFILGYIDLDTRELYLNERCVVADLFEL